MGPVRPLMVVILDEFCQPPELPIATNQWDGQTRLRIRRQQTGGRRQEHVHALDAVHAPNEQEDALVLHSQPLPGRLPVLRAKQLRINPPGGITLTLCGGTP